MQTTRDLWAAQDRHQGDRLRLFSVVAAAVTADAVLYPGSFVDVAASFAFRSVTYVDSDRRAAAFFADAAGVDAIIAAHRTAPTNGHWRFLHADYRSDLDLPTGHHDLLISLYAGFVSEHCTRFLRPGGVLLVNNSHGDASLASLDPRYRLVAVVRSRAGSYRVSDAGLDGYLVPRRPTEVTAAELHRTRRGVAYTKSPHAYLFRLERPRPVPARVAR